MKRYPIIVLMLTVCIASAQPANNFSLPDAKGKSAHLVDFKGKVVVLDFWFTGCINCMNFYHNSLENAEHHYATSKDVVFVSICIDKDKATWIGSLKKSRYTSESSINLYTQGKGGQHPMIKTYQVKEYPQPIIIDKTGQIISRSEQLTKPDYLIQTIDQALKK